MRLESAIVSNDLTLAREALAAGASPDGGSPNRSCLNIAAAAGNIQLINLLLSARASILVPTHRMGQVVLMPTIDAAIKASQLTAASLLLTHIATRPHFVRKISMSVQGSRLEAQPGEYIRPIIADLLRDGGCTASTFAMLVSEGHLQATEPSGLQGLAHRLAGKPGKWLGAQLTLAEEAVSAAQMLLQRSRALRGSVHSSESPTLLLERIRLCLALGARPRWSSRAHQAYPVPFRLQVRTVLLCALRLGGGTAGAAGGGAVAASDGEAESAEEKEPLPSLGSLPREVVLLLIEWLAEQMFWAYPSGRAEPDHERPEPISVV